MAIVLTARVVHPTILSNCRVRVYLVGSRAGLSVGGAALCRVPLHTKGPPEKRWGMCGGSFS